MAEIVLEHVTKRYKDGTEAVKDMNLEIPDGEFVILVGPSGCGKSTALRMIAGLEDITEGELRIGDTVVNDLPPRDRDIAMVFQSYALYPHMTVRENMGFSLKLSKVPKEEINTRVEEAARILDLTEQLDRKPANLSGGQRQRVAMGRAIVRQPAAFLMDEPLSNLDAKLRVQTRVEVSRLQQRLGTTTVYVTHDQTEAMTLGDRVAVMRAGIVQQVGPPQELYERPVNLFVGGFIGSPSMNFMPARVDGNTVQLPMVEAPLPDRLRKNLEGQRELIAGIRPEHFEDASLVGDKRDQGAVFPLKIEVVEWMGAELYAHFSIERQGIESEELAELAAEAGMADAPSAGEEDRVIARLDAASDIREGQESELWIDISKLHFFDAETGRSIDDAREREAAPA
ncbi:MAG: sn-glycerol-3-phosphate ABC transporter ATP-binding protein UgpC [Actinomycetota bacterium]|nr:sn-glycerol-3-phosphate ABC transporter ATP-binding protein UgpC [Actinomycetota bacterium]